MPNGTSCGIPKLYGPDTHQNSCASPANTGDYHTHMGTTPGPHRTLTGYTPETRRKRSVSALGIRSWAPRKGRGVGPRRALLAIVKHLWGALTLEDLPPRLPLSTLYRLRSPAIHTRYLPRQQIRSHLG